jgi:LPXTG-motif cell wall-anchored protein
MGRVDRRKAAIIALGAGLGVLAAWLLLRRRKRF